MTTPDNPTRVGVIGCGTISPTYLEQLRGFPFLEVVALADVRTEVAVSRAAEFGIARAGTVAELLAADDVEVVLNLTIPAAHAEVTAAALGAGKSVYSEKPLATSRADGQALVALASSLGLRLGAAPDTFLGAGLQTGRELVDGGRLGEPVSMTAAFVCHGHESWHPNPGFYYAAGGGPLFDMGPYYLTAMVSLLGPVSRVAGAARVTFEERVVAAGDRAGETIRPEVDTHVTAMLEFAGGATGQLVMSFDGWATLSPPLELQGTAGSMALPDPNTFGGNVRLFGAATGAWEDIPVVRPHAGQSRGLGLADMVLGLREGRPHRADALVALHVLDVMESIIESSRSGTWHQLQTTCARPEPLGPEGLNAEKTLS